MNSFYNNRPNGYLEAIAKLRKAIDEADAVVIGAGAGLSTSAGFIYTGERFNKYFSDFAEKYHFSDMYSGGFYVLESPPEEMWAYWSRYIWINRYMPIPNDTYDRLYDLVKDKDYFVITTNVDHQFQKAGFDKERLFYTQGDYGLWQCSTPCHKRTYDNKGRVVKMLLAQGFAIGQNSELTAPVLENGETDFSAVSTKIPSGLVPYCPVCGEPMTMNLRSDDTFVEDEGWHRASAAYAEFLKDHKTGRVVYLELGVGANTPVIIKYPFWHEVFANKNAFYACINYGEAFCPAEIEDRSVCIDGDIGDVLRKSL